MGFLRVQMCYIFASVCASFLVLFHYLSFFYWFACIVLLWLVGYLIFEIPVCFLTKEEKVWICLGGEVKRIWENLGKGTHNPNKYYMERKTYFQFENWIKWYFVFSQWEWLRLTKCWREHGEKGPLIYCCWDCKFV